MIKYLKNPGFYIDLFVARYVKWPLYEKRVRVRKKKSKYGLVRAEGLDFVFENTDICIPRDMYCYKKVWQSDAIMHFIDLINNYCSDIDGIWDGYFLDIGANIGTTTVYVNKKAKTGMKCIAFEPGIGNFDLLCANIHLNSCKNVFAENVGISDSDQTMIMEVCNANSGGNKIVTNDRKSICTEAVKVTTLDNYLEKKGINAKEISCIWMDVEGHEPWAIHGMMTLLREKAVPLFMEFSPTEYMENGGFMMLYECLEEIYDYYIYDNSSKPERIHGLMGLYDNHKEDRRWQTDLFFFKQ